MRNHLRMEQCFDIMVLWYVFQSPLKELLGKNKSQVFVQYLEPASDVVRSESSDMHTHIHTHAPTTMCHELDRRFKVWRYVTKWYGTAYVFMF